MSSAAMEDIDPTILSIIVGVFVVLASVLVVVLKKCLTSKSDTILIVGLNGSGKTVLFSRLINEENVTKTYTSMIANEFSGYLTSSGSALRLVDFPGAERLRKQLFTKMCHEQRRTLRGIVMVVDSSTFGKQARDVAELLYDVIYETGKSVPVLVACNKQDLAVSKSDQAVQAALEREIGLINQSREASLETTDGTDMRRVLTSSGTDFSWEDIPKTTIEFVECTTQSEEAEECSLSAVIEWIDSL